MLFSNCGQSMTDNNLLQPQELDQVLHNRQLCRSANLNRWQGHVLRISTRPSYGEEADQLNSITKLIDQRFKFTLAPATKFERGP